MEADSSTSKDNPNLHSWNSSETLSDIDEVHYVCQICKSPEQEKQTVIENKRKAEEEEGSSVFFANSTVFLMCLNCNEIFHLHCHVNQVIDLEIFFQTTHQFSFICPGCKHQ